MGGKHWHTRQRRGYDERWIKARAAYLELNPFCIGCNAIGYIVKANVVDHVIPHNGIQTLFWDSRNWQSICAWHHDSIKARLENLYARGKIKRDALRLDSPEAIRLSRRLRRPTIGLDGAPIE